MVETVVSINLPVDERMEIKKNRIEPDTLTGKEKRICLVTGTHGDELEGQYVCYQMNKIINENKQYLKGIVDIYPALNPLGIDSISRGIPMFDLDMNRIFPGDTEGAMPEYVASKIIEDMSGADMCIDIHASNIFLMEIPQVRISEQTAEKLVPYAKELNIDFIWVHAAATVLESTLAHSLNSIGVPTLVVEMGVGMRITKTYGDQLVKGIFNVMSKLGMWTGPVDEPKEAIISRNEEVGFINAEASGVFIPNIKHGDRVKEGEPIGEVVEPLTGKVLSEELAPCTGMVFTLREFPIVYEGSLLARVLREE